MLSPFREWRPTGGPGSGPSRKPETGFAQQVFKGRRALACKDREKGWRRSTRHRTTQLAFWHISSRLMPKEKPCSSPQFSPSSHAPPSVITDEEPRSWRAPPSTCSAPLGADGCRSRTLLSDMAQRTWARWKTGDIGRIDRDLRAAHGVLMGIHKALRTLFTDPAGGYAWIRRPNAAFAGRSALDIMLPGRDHRPDRSARVISTPNGALVNVPVRRVTWSRTVRIIPHDHPPIDLSRTSPIRLIGRRWPLPKPSSTAHPRGASAICPR